MSVLVASSQFQIFGRRLPRLFDESMQQDHTAFFVDVEKHPGDPVLGQTSSHLINAVPQWPANVHPDGPAQPRGLDVLPNAFPVIWRNPPQQLPPCFAALLRPIADLQSVLT